MISTSYIDRYGDNALGEIAIMLSLEGMRPVLPLLGLVLDTPEALRQICVSATQDLPAASYDADDVMGWIRWHHLAGRNLRAADLSSLGPSDQRAVHDWFENGMTGGVHEFPHRLFWTSACRWVARYDKAGEMVEPAELDIMTAFATRFTQKVDAPDFAAARQTLAQNKDGYFDTWQKAKFHINILPDVMINRPLIILNFMRRAHILRRETADFVTEGGDPAVLEKMALLYATRNETSPHLAKYVADHAAFGIDSLWSPRFEDNTL